MVVFFCKRYLIERKSSSKIVLKSIRKAMLYFDAAYRFVHSTSLYQIHFQLNPQNFLDKHLSHDLKLLLAKHIVFKVWKKLLEVLLFRIDVVYLKTCWLAQLFNASLTDSLSFKSFHKKTKTSSILCHLLKVDSEY